MNIKKTALFAGAAVVVAGGLVYILGIYPPASGRDGQGAIGERQPDHRGLSPYQSTPEDRGQTQGSILFSARSFTSSKPTRRP